MAAKKATNWFNQLSKKAQRQYIMKHPDSIYAKRSRATSLSAAYPGVHDDRPVPRKVKSKSRDSGWPTINSPGRSATKRGNRKLSTLANVKTSIKKLRVAKARKTKGA